jgi:ABC-type ATPase involved in cell division
MKKKYIYENAVVYITICDKSTNRIRKATENFLRKVILEKEKELDGNNRKSRIIY